MYLDNYNFKILCDLIQSNITKKIDTIRAVRRYTQIHYHVFISNPLPAQLYCSNVHPLEVASRYRDTQLPVGKKYSYLCNLYTNFLKILIFKHTFYFSLLQFNLKIKHNKNDISRAWRSKG